MTRPKPDLKDPEYVAYATLWNDITATPTKRHLLFSHRQDIADHLWDLGYRKVSEPDESVSAMRPLPLHRTEAGYPNCSTCDGGGCPDCTDLA